jgi:hypothetical protein
MEHDMRLKVRSTVINPSQIATTEKIANVTHRTRSDDGVSGPEVQHPVPAKRHGLVVRNAKRHGLRFFGGHDHSLHLPPDEVW